MSNPVKPNISKDFTIEDIHKIREYNYETRKYMSAEEYAKDVNKKARRGIERVEEIRKRKNRVAI